MITVKSHNGISIVKNPAKPGEQTRMVNVVFQEEGRGGASESISASGAFLDTIMGKQTGLHMTRTHTQPVLETTIGDFPVGKTIENGFINRELYSTPQLRQQESVPARMIDGRPTYFKTWLSNQPSSDVDRRISNDILVDKNPDLFFKARVGGAEVVRVTAPVEVEPIHAETLGQ